MINGAPTDNNAKLFKQGAHVRLQDGGRHHRQVVRHPGLEPRQGPEGDGAGHHRAGQERLRRRLRRQRRHRRRRDRGDEGRRASTPRPPTTGQDAELAAIQRILAGKQYMTVYKAVKPEAEDAAKIAVALAKGESPPAGVVNQQTTTAGQGPVGDPDAGRGDQGQRRRRRSSRTASGRRRRSAPRRSRRPASRRASPDPARTGGGRRGGRPGVRSTERNGKMSTNGALLTLQGVSKRFGAVQALSDVDFEVHAGRGRRARRRQRRRQVHAGQGDRRDPRGRRPGEFLFEGQPVTITSPTDATALGIATVYQDLALCDNLDVVANLFLGSEELSHGPAARYGSSTRSTMEQKLARAARPPRGDDPQRADRGGLPLRRPAPAGGGRPLAARRAEDGDARRAHRRPGRRARPARCSR